MVSVRKFLCWDLYTAGIIIGWVSLALSIVEILASYFVVDNVTIIFPGIDAHGNRRQTLAFFGLFCALSVVDAVGSILLILAVFKRNHFFVIPWLANGVAFAIISVLFIVVQFFTNVEIPYFVIGIVLIHLALLAYAWIAVYSFYITLRNVAISKNQLPA